MNRIIVLGSLNIDMVIQTNKMPEIGQTVLGETFDYFLGGKGANQAVAAAKAGANVKMVGKIGDDTFGKKILNHLVEDHIDVEDVQVVPNLFTGLATIYKLPEDNAIVVIPGANMALESDDLLCLKQKKKGTDDVLLTQLEIPIEVVGEALKNAKEQGMITIVNPAPYHPSILEFLEHIDYITPNELEFAEMAVEKQSSKDSIDSMMLNWQMNHKTKLIVTRGADGVSYVENGEVVTVPSMKVDVVDTTGAGDTFNGLLAKYIGIGESFRDSVKKASIGASLSIQKLGAQTGMPSESEIEVAMKKVEIK